jgi:ribosomal protein S20
VVWANEAASQAEVRRVMQAHEPEADDAPDKKPVHKPKAKRCNSVLCVHSRNTTAAERQ